MYNNEHTRYLKKERNEERNYHANLLKSIEQRKEREVKKQSFFLRIQK